MGVAVGDDDLGVIDLVCEVEVVFERVFEDGVYVLVVRQCDVYFVSVLHLWF